MVFSRWQIGLAIQDDGVRAIAISRGRQGWRLRRWWFLAPSLETATGSMRNLTDTLRAWQRTLPLGYQLRVAFPSGRTLTREIPAPVSALTETQCMQYLSAATGERLRMAAEELTLDYCLREEGSFSVVAAKKTEIEELRQILYRARLHVWAIIPDACALTSFLPYLAAVDAKRRTYIAREQSVWVWADEKRWGAVSVQEAETSEALCTSLGIDSECAAFATAAAGDSAFVFDPWRTLRQIQPPVPADNARYAVPLGLALASLT